MPVRTEDATHQSGHVFVGDLPALACAGPVAMFECRDEGAEVCEVGGDVCLILCVNGSLSCVEADA